jgi:hypothetical protein
LLILLVFGKKEVIKGLDKDEQVLFDRKVKYKTGFMKKEKDIIVVTNKRFICADQDTKQPEWAYDLTELEFSVSDIKYDSTAGKTRGFVEVIKEGRRLYGFYADDPDGLLRQINAFLRSRSTNSRLVSAPTEEKVSAGEDPLTILKLRYAKGEITREQFDEMMGLLGHPSK